MNLNYIVYHKLCKSILIKICSLLFLISLLAFVSGCKKFVQVDPPITQLVTASVFDNDPSATSAQVAIYSQMVNNQDSWNLSLYCGLLSDELTNYSTDIVKNQAYTNSLIATSSPNKIWNDGYTYIYEANAIINGLQTYGGVSASAKQQLMGESKFVRAFWFFYLSNLYGDIPLPLTPDYSANSVISRSPKAQVYQQIIKDLSEAENLLNPQYVDFSDTTVTSERVRPTKWAAAALLARSYLYTNKYDSAENQATLVINNPTYILINPLTMDSSGFTINNSEAIWQLSTPLPAYNGATADGQGYILLGAPNSITGISTSTQLMNSFETNDIRKNMWIGSYTTADVNPVTYYYPFKYKVYSSSDVTEYITVLRLAEQYLIRAEARIQHGDLNGSLADLNMVRKRAGLPIYTGAMDKGSILNAILHERQVELFTEWGHRWFDLIRTGTANTVMGSPGNVCQYKGGTWNPNSQLWPIPQSEILIDRNLVQNPGYN